MQKVKSGLIKRLHVNKNVVRQNVKNNEDEPCLTCQTSNGPIRGKKIELLDKDGEVIAVLKQEICNPLSCGARVYLETKLEVVIDE